MFVSTPQGETNICGLHPREWKIKDLVRNMPFGDIEFNIVYGNHLQRSFRVRVLAICPRKGQIEDKIRHSRYARWLIFKRTPRWQLHHHHASS